MRLMTSFLTVTVLGACLCARMVSGQTGGPEETATQNGSESSDVGEIRRFQLTAANLATRMRSVQSSDGRLNAVSQQHKEFFAGIVSLDKAGHYTVTADLSSGYYFTRSYAETGWGDDWYGERGAKLFVRRLYFQAEPVAGIDFQYGSLPLLYGSVSDNLSYDEDGYIAGERLSIKRPRNLFLDEISVTYAYLGDYYKPNVFQRLGRFSQSNYHQFLLAKRLHGRVTMSADLTHHGWSETIRAGVKLNTKGLKVLDELRAGFYNRYSNDSGSGFDVMALKRIGKRLSLSGGWVSIDLQSIDLITPYDLQQQPPASKTLISPGGSLNGGGFVRGSNPWGSFAYKLNSMLKLSLYDIVDVSQRVGSVTKNNHVLLLGIDCDLLPALKHAGLR